MNGGYKYRICRKCGKEWNVSVKNKSGKHYICPKCGKGGDKHT